MILDYEREVAILSDGGQVYQDYYPRNFAELDWLILVVVPGFNAGPYDAYVGYTALEAQKRKLRTVIFKKRMFKGIQHTARHMISWARIEDFDEIGAVVCRRSPLCKLYAIGFSMGYNFLQYYLGEKGKAGKGVPMTSSVTTISTTQPGQG